MFIAQPYCARMSTSSEVRSLAHIPMIYEPAPSAPLRWEYHVLTVDPQEASLPDADRLNVFGSEGWVLVSLLDERMTGKGKLIHYYFVRQPKEQ
jgi:hypothetical protein